MHSTGRQGSAIADDFIHFAGDEKWQKAIMNYSKKYASQVVADYQAYCKAYDLGQFTG